MKNPIPQFSIVLIALIALTFLMGYTKPAAEEPKRYIILIGENGTKAKGNLTEQVNQKLAEGWHLQGGVSLANFASSQAMVK